MGKQNISHYWHVGKPVACFLEIYSNEIVRNVLQLASCRYNKEWENGTSIIPYRKIKAKRKSPGKKTLIYKSKWEKFIKLPNRHASRQDQLASTALQSGQSQLQANQQFSLHVST